MNMRKRDHEYEEDEDWFEDLEKEAGIITR